MKLNLTSTAVSFAMMLAGLLALVPSSVAAAPKFISIGTGGVTGVYYPTGGAICRLVNRNHKVNGLRCSVESTGGSVYNINTVRAGELEFGVAQSDWQYHADHGTSKFKEQGKFEDLRSVFSLHPEPVTVLARSDAGINNIEDLKGKRLNIGNPGSGTRATWEVLEEALGWQRSDLKLAATMKSAETAQALCDNKIDAYFWLVGHPSALTQETVSSCHAVLVNVAGEAIDKLVAQNPFYRHATIPGGMYPGQPDDVKTFGVGATFITSAKVPEAVVYEVAKAVLGNLDVFRKLHPAFAHLNADEMIKDSLSAPLHDGAIKAYKELGLMP
jgi:TRAP transporter TAXI family solute receptor